MSPFAVAAVVIEELDHGQLAFGITGFGILGGIELLGMGLDHRLVIRGLLSLLLGTQGVGHLDQDFRILDQIITHYLFDIGLGQFAGLDGGREQEAPARAQNRACLIVFIPSFLAFLQCCL